MVFLKDADSEKRIRFLRQNLQPIRIRGWNWESPPVKPVLNLGLGVSELVSRYCGTMRDIYIKRVLGRKPIMTPLILRGLIYHEAISNAITDVKRFLFSRGISTGYEVLRALLPTVEESVTKLLNEVGVTDEDLKRDASTLYRFIVIQLAAEVDRTLSRHPRIELDSLVFNSLPTISERVVDGSLIGLGRQVRIDLLLEGIIVDVKTGEMRDFHRLGPVGYALALEADSGTPVDLGAVMYVRVSEWPLISYDIFELSDELRMEFLSLRDEASAILVNSEDPGRPLDCSELCPLWEACP
ncbi:MAG: type I-A CRISPR-associated protein Cas4/Csa1 [Candidatus Korarchaeum sp.]|nr:type I-A CRISPR-associated protein Cas4/Csa1 [Candidatus Korarchaeum sp.]